MTAQTAVFGDVHGEATKLGLALSDLKSYAETLVGLGDYVNRGTDSKATLDTLIDAKTSLRGRLRLLAGNHELELLRFLDEGDFGRFAAMGGLPTIASYLDPSEGDVVRRFRDSFPKSHRSLLENLEPQYETDEFLISHTGFDPNRPHQRGIDVSTRSFPAIFHFEGAWPRPLVVVGHYLQSSGLPHVSEHLYGLDTGCGTRTDAPLTALLVQKREVRQYR